MGETVGLDVVGDTVGEVVGETVGLDVLESLDSTTAFFIMHDVMRINATTAL